MGYLKFSLAAAFAAGLLMYPGQALAAVIEAMGMWYRSVAPALFPFAALMPYLTSPQARYIYDKFLGWFMRLAFALPGRCASAFVTGLFSGSPGGAMAAARVAAAERLSPGQAARLAGICCGMSPVYLVSGLGTAIMGAPAVGWRLVASQWLAHILVGIGFSGCWRGDGAADTQYIPVEQESSVTGAVSAVLRVCGYMMLFSAGIAVFSAATGLDMKTAGIFLDLPGGAAEAVEKGVNLRIFAPAAGFGGVCIAAQNMAVLRSVGVTWSRYLLQKAAAACLCAGIYAIAENMEYSGAILPGERIFETALLVLTALALPVTAMFFVRNRRHSTDS